MDPLLKDWLNQNFKTPKGLPLEVESYKTFFLIPSSSPMKKSLFLKTYHQMIAYKNSHGYDHWLMPRLMEQALSKGIEHPGISSFGEENFEKFCQKGDLFLERFLKKTSAWEKAFEKIQNLYGTRKKEALDRLVRSLPDSVRKDWERDYDRLPKSHEVWREVFLHGQALRCEKGENLWKSLMSQGPKEEDWNEALESLKSLGHCWRKKNRKSRIQLWQEALPFLERAFAEKGVAEANLILARLFWNRDQFEEALKILENFQGTSDQKGSALFLKAKIQENLGQFSQARQSYEECLKFPCGQREEASISLLLMNAEQGLWTEVQKDAQLILEKGLAQNEAFALFWYTRALLHEKKYDQALHYAKLLATDHFSTYYGAMGHYIVEKIMKKKFRLWPSSQNKTFQVESLTEVFRNQPHLWSSAKAIESLLQVGDRQGALCELRHLGQAPLTDSQKLSVALWFYHSQSWLEAVQFYTALPRNFRRTLPHGMEQVLFPKQFYDSISKRAAHHDLDAELITSLIRQESVFNPKARSSAGAYGLMQVIPTVARDITKTLPKGKKYHSNSLYEAEWNLFLGVQYLKNLWKNYKNPILALSAYNAGPSPVNRWVKTYSTDDWLIFMEKIPYKETRDYVRLIFRNYFYYKRWYTKDPVPVLENLMKNLNFPA